MGPMTALYRKHRPQTFDEVVGQERVVRTLRNAIETDRVRQAYLFAGPRGTGKTSLARILAKSLNCERGPTTTPCDECTSCTSIAAGSSLDVIEMDAASQRGIDDVREIRERAILQPTARHKIYIFDEAHQLTKDAFNALLKLIEEPPPHLIFVFCTTELDRMLPTVRSRCQTFLFARPRLSDLQQLLRSIADAEGINAADPALSQIARAARGSFRDGVSTLDQLVSATGGEVTLADTLQLLGAIEEDSLMRLVDLVIDSDTPGALRLIEEMSNGGHDLGRLITDLLEHLRHLMLLQHLAEVPETLPVAPDAHERIRSQSTQLGPAATLRLIDLLAGAIEDVRQGGDPRLPLELALVKITRPEVDLSRDAILLRLDRLEQPIRDGPDRSTPTHRAATATDAGPPAATEPDEPPPAQPSPPAGPQTRVPREEPAAPPPPDGQAKSVANGGGESSAGDVGVPPLPPLALDELAEVWSSQVIPAVGEHSTATATILAGSRPISLDGARLVVGLPAATSFQRQLAEDPRNARLLGRILHEATGRHLEVAFEALVAPEPQPEEEATAQTPPSEDELVALLKETFDAEEVARPDDEG